MDKENLDPFIFNLRLSIENNGKLSSCNPFKNDPDFLRKLAASLEKSDKIETSLRIKRRLANLN